MINRARALKHLRIKINNPKKEIIYTPDKHLSNILSFASADANDALFLAFVRKYFVEQHAEVNNWSDEEVTDFLIGMPNKVLKDNPMMLFFCEDKFTESYEKNNYRNILTELLEENGFNISKHKKAHKNKDLIKEKGYLKQNKENFNVEASLYIKEGMLSRKDEVSEEPEGLKSVIDNKPDNYEKKRNEQGYYIQKLYSNFDFSDIFPEINSLSKNLDFANL